MNNDLIGVAAVDAIGTLLIDPTSDPGFVDLLYSDHSAKKMELDSFFSKRNGNGYETMAIRKMIRETQRRHNIPDDLQPNVLNLTRAIRTEGERYGLVALSTIPAHVALDTLLKLGIDVHAAYGVSDDVTNRDDLAAFEKIRKTMRSTGHVVKIEGNIDIVSRRYQATKPDNPKLYWTGNHRHAEAAANEHSFGKALLCVPEDYEGPFFDPGKSGIYLFTHEDLAHPENVFNIIDFVYG
ncbi:MAG: hypothetical protein JXC85_04900 [Candidatus Aenigmarchaeota archaeon]|nr:hypothetical protein [Candidatus Aenigmarchaeota archaeon]